MRTPSPFGLKETPKASILPAELLEIRETVAAFAKDVERRSALSAAERENVERVRALLVRPWLQLLRRHVETRELEDCLRAFCALHGVEIRMSGGHYAEFQENSWTTKGNTAAPIELPETRHRLAIIVERIPVEIDALERKIRAQATAGAQNEERLERNRMKRTACDIDRDLGLTEMLVRIGARSVSELEGSSAAALQLFKARHPGVRLSDSEIFGLFDTTLFRAERMQ